MANLVQLRLNPIDLGILFLCVCVGVWVLAHCKENKQGYGRSRA